MTSQLKVVRSDALSQFSDKCKLPPSLLKEAISSYETLPHPMIYMLNNGLFVGVKEFTAPEGEIHVPEQIWDRLKTEYTQCVLHLLLPKATSMCIRPTQFYPHVTNWKYYLESFLSSQFTVLSEGQTFSYHDSVASVDVELIVDKASAPSVVVVDTDIELDIVPLNDIMAAQQLHKESLLLKYEVITEIILGVNTAVTLEPFNKTIHPMIYKIDLSRLSEDIEVTILSNDNLFNVDLLCSLDRFISLENFLWSTMEQDSENIGRKTVSIDISSDLVLNSRIKHSPLRSLWLFVVPFAWENNSSVEILATHRLRKKSNLKQSPERENTVDKINCQNCSSLIDKCKISLHEAFCFRNNVRCTCGVHFSKAVPGTHWHCDKCDDVHGESALFRWKHDKLYHNGPYICKHCLDETEHPSFLQLVQSHKAHLCPARIHECQFCHLVLPQGESTYEDRILNLTHHENECGNKTIECYQCNKVLRTKDLASHLKIHEMVKSEKTAEILLKCANVNCVSILQKQENDLTLCATCFGPLYLGIHDPEHKKLQGRIERRYVLQLTQGCGNTWCCNKECANGNSQLDFKSALAHVKKNLLSQIGTPNLPANAENSAVSKNLFWFCVSESMQQKSNLATSLIEEAQYSESMIYKAVTGSHKMNARVWLAQNV